VNLLVVGERIKRIRGDLSQLEFGKALSIKNGFSQNYISAIEKGKTKPSIEFLEAVSWYRDISIDRILTGCNFRPSSMKLDMNVSLVKQLSKTKVPEMIDLLAEFDLRIKYMAEIANSMLSLQDVEKEAKRGQQSRRLQQIWDERDKEKDRASAEFMIARDKKKGNLGHSSQTTVTEPAQTKLNADIINHVVLLKK